MGDVNIIYSNVKILSKLICCWNMDCFIELEGKPFWLIGLFIMKKMSGNMCNYWNGVGD